MNYGEEHRSYRETAVHDHSSRSHTIFRIFIKSKNSTSQDQNAKSELSGFRYSNLNLVDLAGSERLSECQEKPESSSETGHINKSLFALSNVINKLSEGKFSHIPYRDSKLTRILQNALGGNSLTAIVCNVSPAALNYGQTVSTIRFALRAKNVLN